MAVVVIPPGEEELIGLVYGHNNNNTHAYNMYISDCTLAHNGRMTFLLSALSPRMYMTA